MLARRVNQPTVDTCGRAREAKETRHYVTVQNLSVWRGEVSAVLFIAALVVCKAGHAVSTPALVPDGTHH